MIVTISSNKGGTGKTTTAVSLAHAFAQMGHETLLIDFDSQAHCAICLGRDPEPGVYHWLQNEETFWNCRRLTRIEGLDLLPGDSHSKTVDRSHTYVREALRDLLEDYDRIVIDTPAAGLLQESAIAAADKMVVPVRLEHLAMDGLNATLSLTEQLNPRVPAIVLPTQYDSRLSEHKYNLGILGDQGERMTLASPIPSRVAVAEAVAAGQTVWEYNSKALEPVCTAYTVLRLMLEGETG